MAAHGTGMAAWGWKHGGGSMGVEAWGWDGGGVEWRGGGSAAIVQLHSQGHQAPHALQTGPCHQDVPVLYTRGGGPLLPAVR
jgi:hypothetical protein